MKNDEVRKIVKKRYGKIAKESSCGCGCGCGQDAEAASMDLGYERSEVTSFGDANLGLGCGSPTAIAGLRKGETVLDMGSGAGFDCFIAARKVGSKGRVIGVDMTPEMLAKARRNAKKYGASNVEFRRGRIEELPLEDSSVDAIISNCVINLSPEKEKVFREAHRVLKPGGRLHVSDIVLLKPLTKRQREDADLIAGCVGGAIMKDDYLGMMKDAGFDIRTVSRNEYPDQGPGISIESIHVSAIKRLGASARAVERRRRRNAAGW